MSIHRHEKILLLVHFAKIKFSNFSFFNFSAYFKTDLESYPNIYSTAKETHSLLIGCFCIKSGINNMLSYEGHNCCKEHVLKLMYCKRYSNKGE